MNSFPSPTRTSSAVGMISMGKCKKDSSASAMELRLFCTNPSILQPLIFGIFPQIATRVMGIETSQLFCYHRVQDPVHPPMHPNLSPWSPIRIRGPHWSLVNSIVLEDWMNGTAERYGFDIWGECCSNFKVHKKPWSQFVITHKDSRRKETKLCSFPCMVEEMAQEERISWRMKSATVLAVSDQIIVIQVVVVREVKMFVVDWHMDTILGTYTLSYKDEPCLQECFISPDSRILLLRGYSKHYDSDRPNYITGYFDLKIRVIKLGGGLCKELYVMQDKSVQSYFGSGISFDPRHDSQIAIITGAHQSAGMKLSILNGSQKYDLKTRETIVMQPACTTDTVYHIRYSSDGRFLAVLCVDVLLGCCSDPSDYNYEPMMSDEHVKLLCGITLKPLAVLPKSREHFDLCIVSKTQMFPIFSKDSSFIAQIDSTSGSAVRVHYVPSSSSFDTLKEAARRSILWQVQRRYIKELPLPQPMINYLLFRDDML